MPQGRDPVTWFRGNRYRGGFEYTVSGGGLQVVNVVDLEDYVKGVLPSEMPGNWELEALKAQAVCARTFACLTTKHLSAYGFDVCSPQTARRTAASVRPPPPRTGRWRRRRGVPLL